MDKRSKRPTRNTSCRKTQKNPTCRHDSKRTMETTIECKSTMDNITFTNDTDGKGYQHDILSEIFLNKKMITFNNMPLDADDKSDVAALKRTHKGAFDRIEAFLTARSDRLKELLSIDRNNGTLVITDNGKTTTTTKFSFGCH